MIIDRFEGDYAIIEISNGEFIEIPIIEIPKGAKEGDVLTLSIDRSQTEKRREKIEGLINELWDWKMYSA